MKYILEAVSRDEKQYLKELTSNDFKITYDYIDEEKTKEKYYIDINSIDELMKLVDLLRDKFKLGLFSPILIGYDNYDHDPIITIYDDYIE